MRSLLLILTFIPFVFGVNPPNDHDFHNSMTKIEYNQPEKSLSVAMKIDIHDIEAAVGVALTHKDFEAGMRSYILSKIEITINNQPRTLKYSGKQESGEVIWVYFEISGVEKIETIIVKNTLLIEKFSSQQNFISFNISGKKTSDICHKDKISVTKKFD